MHNDAQVELREYRAEDITGIRSWVNDQAVTQYMGPSYARPQTWEQTEENLHRILSGDSGGYHFVIADSETGAYLGQCDLMHIDYISRRAELTIVLPAANCDHGIGRKAVRLLAKYGFSAINLNRIYLYVYADNHRAMRCYEACGFQKEGVLRQDVFRYGEYSDRVIMGLLRSQFVNPDP